jgi:hypothetical protein
LDKMGLLNLETKARLELLVLRRIARDLDASAKRLEAMKATQALRGIDKNVHVRVLNAAVHVKTAGGNLRLEIEGLRGER